MWDIKLKAKNEQIRNKQKLIETDDGVAVTRGDEEESW